MAVPTQPAYPPPGHPDSQEEEAAPAEAASAQGYQDVGFGNMRRRDGYYRARAEGGITGFRGPRFGTRGGKTANTLWWTEYYKQKKLAERRGDWDAFNAWQKKHPKPPPAT